MALETYVGRLGGDNEGKWLLRMAPVHKKSLEGSEDWLNHNMGWYRGRAIHQPDPISWLLEQTADLYLVRILGKDHRRGVSNDHVAYIDSNKGKTMDCVERYVMIFLPRIDLVLSR